MSNEINGRHSAKGFIGFYCTNQMGRWTTAGCLECRVVLQFFFSFCSEVVFVSLQPRKEKCVDMSVSVCVHGGGSARSIDPLHSGPKPVAITDVELLLSWGETEKFHRLKRPWMLNESVENNTTFHSNITYNVTFFFYPPQEKVNHSDPAPFLQPYKQTKLNYDLSLMASDMTLTPDPRLWIYSTENCSRNTDFGRTTYVWTLWSHYTVSLVSITSQTHTYKEKQSTQVVTKYPGDISPSLCVAWAVVNSDSHVRRHMLDIHV